jgi:hypothetical protein
MQPASTTSFSVQEPSISPKKNKKIFDEIDQNYNLSPN